MCLSSVQVVDHYENPRNVGSLDKNDRNVGTGLVGAPACGDVMKLQVSGSRAEMQRCPLVHEAPFEPISALFSDPGRRKRQDHRRAIQNFWLRFSNRLQFLGHRVGEGQVGEWSPHAPLQYMDQQKREPPDRVDRLTIRLLLLSCCRLMKL